MSDSELTNKILLRLLHDIASGTILSGEHVGAQQVADRYGVSRTPVRDALVALEKKGVLKRIPNRGYFVEEPTPGVVQEWLQQELGSQGDDYQQLADDWLEDRIPGDITEQFLRQRYGWTKAKVSDLLTRAFHEGWVERKEGYGWRLLPVAKTPEAFDQIYRLRMTIEPAAMLEPSFELDRKVLAEQRRIQNQMLENDLGGMLDETLLNNGSIFHEELIKLSRNPFYLMALQRVNRMRRLMEYKAKIDRERLIEQCTEHLEILDQLECGDVIGASYCMRQHLSGALKRKSPLAWGWAADSEQATTKPLAV